MAGEGAPDLAYLAVQVAAAAQAVEASALTVAPFAGTLAGADIFPLTVLTGANTDSRTVQVFNRGQDGSGTTLMASKAFTTGVNAPAESDTPLTLSVVAGATAVAAGDVIEVKSLHVGAGLAAPQFLARLQVSRVSGS